MKTKYGTVSVKIGKYNGKIIKTKPEFEECKKIAKKNNISLLNLYNEINKKI
ncbi:MAG: nickel insertion protein [Nanoarchaeota archaeon]